MRSRQRDRVAPVRLNPLARPFWDQGRSDHHAIVAEGVNLAVKPVSRRPGFKADMQTVVPVRQSLDRPLDRKRTVFDVAEKSDFPGPAAFRDRHGVLLLRHVESNKSFVILSHGPPSAHEARLGLPDGRLRRWLPRHLDIDRTSDQDIQEIVLTTNLTPRKCLGFKTPFQALIAELGKDVQIRFS
jgi:hypothetical protein